LKRKFGLVLLLTLLLLVAMPKNVFADNGVTPLPLKPISLLLEISDLHFSNNSKETIVFNSVDFNSKEKLSYTWRAGEKGTYPIWNFSAPLIAHDQDGNIIKVFIPTDQSNQSVVITQSMVDWAKTAKIMSFPLLKSIDTRTSIGFNFVNKSLIPLDLYWIDWDGKEEKFGILEPGKILGGTTGFFHAWRLRDQNGNIILEYIMTEATKQTVTITNGMVAASLGARLAEKPNSATESKALPFKPLTDQLVLTSITFVNNSKETLKYSYVGMDGVEAGLTELAKGKKATYAPTWFSGNSIVRDQDGNIVSVYLITADAKQSFTTSQAMVDWAKTAKVNAFASLRSLKKCGDEVPVVPLTFVNKTFMSVNVFWVDCDGKEQKIKGFETIDAGSKNTITSDTTHTWRLRDKSGNIILEYVVSEATKQTVTIKNDVLAAVYEYMLSK
jgi:hypothetical protein